MKKIFFLLLFFPLAVLAQTGGSPALYITDGTTTGRARSLSLDGTLTDLGNNSFTYTSPASAGGVTSVNEGVAGPLVVNPTTGAVVAEIQSVDTTTDGYLTHDSFNTFHDNRVSGDAVLNTLRATIISGDTLTVSGKYAFPAGEPTLEGSVISYDSVTGLLKWGVIAGSGAGGGVSSVTEGVASPLIISPTTGAVVIDILSADNTTAGYIDANQYLKINIISSDLASALPKVASLTYDVGVLKPKVTNSSSDIALLKAPTYICKTASTVLTGEQALSSLTTGIMYVTNATGAITSLGNPLPIANGGTASAVGYTVVTNDVAALKIKTTIISNDMAVITPKVNNTSYDVGVLKPIVSNLSYDVGVLKPKVSNLSYDVGLLIPKVNNISYDVGVIKPIVTNLSNDMAVVMPKVNNLSYDVGVMKPRVSNLSYDVGVLKPIVTNLSNDVGDLKLNRVSTDAILNTLTVNTTIKIPNSTNPTLSSAGSIAIDSSATSGDAIRFYGDAEYVLPAWQPKSFTVTNPTAESDYSLGRVPYSITMKESHLLCGKGTDVGVKLLSCDVNGQACVVFSTLIGSAGINTLDTGISSVVINKGSYLSVDTFSVNGAVSAETVTYYYVPNAVN